MSSRVPICFAGLIDGDLGQEQSWIDLFIIYDQIELFRKIIDHGLGCLFYSQVTQERNDYATLERILLNPFSPQIQLHLKHSTNFSPKYHRHKNSYNHQSLQLRQSLMLVQIRRKIYNLSLEEFKKYLDQLSPIIYTKVLREGYTKYKQDIPRILSNAIFEKLCPKWSVSQHSLITEHRDINHVLLYGYCRYNLNQIN